VSFDLLCYEQGGIYLTPIAFAVSLLAVESEQVRRIIPGITQHRVFAGIIAIFPSYRAIDI
jgi:hypothetical protein